MSRTSNCIHCNTSTIFYIARDDEYRARKCFCDGAVDARRKLEDKSLAKGTVAGKKKKKSSKINYDALALVFG